MSLDQWASFALTTLLFALVPGPTMLYIVAQILAHDRWAAVAAVLGVHFGCYVHVLAAATGLSAVFHHMPELYTDPTSSGLASCSQFSRAEISRSSRSGRPGEPKRARRR